MFDLLPFLMSKFPWSERDRTFFRWTPATPLATLLVNNESKGQLWSWRDMEVTLITLPSNKEKVRQMRGQTVDYCSFRDTWSFGGALSADADILVA